MYDYRVFLCNFREVTIRANGEDDAMSRASKKYGSTPIWAERSQYRGEF